MYLLINYGDYVDGSNTKALPYVQLLSTTDPTSAHLDFVNIRLGGTDTTGDQMLSATSTSSPDDVNDINKSSDDAKKTATIAGVVISAVFVVATAFIAYFTYKRRHKRHLVPTTAHMGSYRPLQLAAPAGELHLVQGYHDEVGHTWTRDFNPEDLYAPAAPLHEEGHGIPLSRYGEAQPRNTP